MINQHFYDIFLFFSLPLDRGTENYTMDVQGEETLLKLRKIVCFITADKTGSYNKTTGEDEVLVLRTIYAF